MATNSGFSVKTDFFGLATADSGLKVRSSQDGATSQLAEAPDEYGDTRAKDVYGEVFAPQVEYAVVDDVDLSAMAPGMVVSFGSGSSEKKFMIATVAVATAPGNPPTITVTGVEVEGDAAQRRVYEFAGTVSPRSKSQDPFGALRTGLLPMCASVNSTASIDPHVTTVTGKPVFSDASHCSLSVAVTLTDTTGSSSIEAATGFELIPVESASYPDSAYVQRTATLVKYLTGSDSAANS